MLIFIFLYIINKGKLCVVFKFLFVVISCFNISLVEKLEGREWSKERNIIGLKLEACRRGCYPAGKIKGVYLPLTLKVHPY